MSRTLPNPDISYPVGLSIVMVNGVEFPIPTPADALTRLQTYFAARYGYDELGHYNVPEDSLHGAVKLLIERYTHALSGVAGLSMGVHTSCAHETQYAGDVVSEGNRIFTPQQFAENYVSDLGKLDLIFAPFASSNNFEEARVSDPAFLNDVVVVIAQARLAVFTLQTVASGVYTSCAHESQYVGGVKSEGNRILTAQESASFSFDQLKQLENNQRG